MHVVALHSYSSFFCCRTRGCSGLAASLPRTPEPRAFLARVTPCLHRPCATAAASLARARQYREHQPCSSAATPVLFCSRATTPRAPLQHRVARVPLTHLRDASRTSRVHLRACGRPLLASARSPAPAAPKPSRCALHLLARSSPPPALCSWARPSCRAAWIPSAGAAPAPAHAAVRALRSTRAPARAAPAEPPAPPALARLHACRAPLAALRPHSLAPQPPPPCARACCSRSGRAAWRREREREKSRGREPLEQERERGGRVKRKGRAPG
jgi:hypothetical protein